MRPTFFEGPEKKVELVVADGHPPLRGLGEAFWRGVVAAARAEVRSEIANAHLDAWLLSESSLFVHDRFVTMITCGRTTLVDAVEAMLERVAPAALVYERKNEHVPDAQPSRFADDARRLARRVPGRTVCFGDERGHAVRIFHGLGAHRPGPGDRTLEILMHGIDPARAERFRAPPPDGGLAPRLGLSLALRGHRVDEHVFTPAGYSLNAIRDAAYTTLHVTPERLGSYAGFETCAPDFGAHLPELVAEVVGAFAPEVFDVVVFEPDARPVALAVPGYALARETREPVAGWHVTFFHFGREGATPRSPT